MPIIVCDSIYSVHPCIQTFVWHQGVIWEDEYSQVEWDKSMFCSENQFCLAIVLLI